MFRFLRLRLTLLYLCGSLLLVFSVGATAYILLQNNFRSSVDLALQHRVALALHEIGEPLPAALIAGEQAWYSERDSEEQEKPSSEEDDSGSITITSAPGALPLSAWQTHEPEFDAELSPITLAALRANGGVDSLAGGTDYDLEPAILAAALQAGSDLRTAVNPNGHTIRLFTIRLEKVPGYIALQAGRSLEDQDHLLADLVMGLLQWGIGFAIFLAALSWWLSGRALSSTQQAWEKQQSFVAHAGHELRTPLTMIRAAAEVAQRKSPLEEPRRILDEIIAETGRMSRLVDDLLLLSRLDAGALRIPLRPVDLTPLLRETLANFGRVAQERSVTLIAGLILGKAKAEEARLRQVLLILLDNAMRHSNAGAAIEVGTFRAGRMIRITVRDHGGGIPPEELPHVFERFYRGRNEPAEGGSGLGLAIARELVELMRGDIQLASEPGKGTTVTLEFESVE